MESPTPRIRGVTLVETLIALVVLAFGLLALVGFQLSLARNADVARQRTEAARLAQSKVEQLRAFEDITAYGHLSAGSDVPVMSSNTRYARSWTLSGDGADLQRRVRVTLTWTGRGGDIAPNTVSLTSVISRTDPADVGSLAVPTIGNSAVLRIGGRASTIPVTAIELGGANRGKSTQAWAGASGGFLVFDNVSGAVTARCATRPGDSTDIAASCAGIAAYLLQGYIGGALPADPLNLVFDRLQYVDPTSTPECIVDNALAAQSGAVIAGLKRYRCLIRPTDHDADASTPRVWSGRSRLAGLASGSSTCRYTPRADTAVNAEHPETYTLVTGSLEHQNFLLIASGDCPSGTVLHPRLE
jgi:Tfp pilus assembly protein PilV